MRARRWTSKLQYGGFACLLGVGLLCALTIFLCAQDDRKLVLDSCNSAAEFCKPCLSSHSLLHCSSHKRVIRERDGRAFHADGQSNKRMAEERDRQERSRLIEQLQVGQIDFKKVMATRRQAGAYQPPAQDRRGIVICAGGNKLLINAYVSVKVLRDTLQSTLPMEIYHNGKADVGPMTKAAFSVFPDVTFIDLETVTLPNNHSRPTYFNGYVAKVMSLYVTQFNQVHYLDADSQPLKDPLHLFESDTFRERGNIFWPDYWKEGFSESPHGEVYEWLGLHPPWKVTYDWQCAESGQIFIDKRRHWDVLEWLWFLNSHAELLYKYMLGDKDTFEIAFMLAGKHQQFHRVPISPGVPLTAMYKELRRGGWKERYIQREEAERYMRVGVLQYDASGVPAFMHRTERTKFANFVDGLSAEKMRPILVIPSFGPNIPLEAKEAAWNLVSVPKSMVSLNCTCCVPDISTHTVVRKALEVSSTSVGLMTHDLAFSHLWLSRNSSNVTGCKWKSRSSLPKLPVFPFSIFGPFVAKVMDSGFAAYADLESLLGERIRWEMSP